MANNNIVLFSVGHPNAPIVHQWESDPIQGCTLTSASKFPSAIYSGMLPGTLGYQFDDDEPRIDLATLCERAGAKLVLAETHDLDLQTETLHFADHDSIPFDALMIDVGSMPAGWKMNGNAKSLVPIKPMQTFFGRLTRRSTTIRFAIVGGDVARVEIKQSELSNPKEI